MEHRLLAAPLIRSKPYLLGRLLGSISMPGSVWRRQIDAHIRHVVAAFHVVSYGRAGTMLASIERSKRLIDSVPSARGSGGGSSEFVEWSDALSVGVVEIDDQHKELIKMLNKLNTAIHGGWGKETRREVIDQLVEYTRVHFTTEESVMSIAGYPDVEAHKRKHHDLILKVKDYVSKYEKNPDASSYDLLFFLKQWLTEHIIKSDKALGDYLLANGPKAGGAKKSWLRRLFGL